MIGESVEKKVVWIEEKGVVGKEVDRRNRKSGGIGMG